MQECTTHGTRRLMRKRICIYNDRPWLPSRVCHYTYVPLPIHCWMSYWHCYTARISSISASQALRASSTQLPSASASVPGSFAHSLSTGLDGLDDAISPTPGPSSGIPRGSITEIYGPPGVGKTSFSFVPFFCSLDEVRREVDLSSIGWT